MRSLKKMQTTNNGSRAILESIISDSIIKSLEDWIKIEPNFVLIGGLAVSFYLKPRTTQDIDFLLISDTAIPTKVKGFKKVRKHAFEHNKTHVEIEIVTPEFVNIPSNVVAHIIMTSRINNGVKIASPSGLVASKLFRLSASDKADIINLINYDTINLDGFGLPTDRIEKFLILLSDAEEDAKIINPFKNDEL